MNEEDGRAIRTKLSHTREALLEEIGASLSTTEGFDLKAISASELRVKAEQWLALHEAGFVQKICREWKFSEKVKDPRYRDNVFLAGAIADLIAALVGKVAPFTVAAFLVKRGIETLCG